MGFTVTASYNFKQIVILEPALLLRWYFLSMKKENTHAGLFAQLDAGAYIGIEDGEIAYINFENGKKSSTWFTGGLRVGYRFAIGKMFYVEPYGRGGYPYIFGIGTMAGIRF